MRKRTLFFAMLLALHSMLSALSQHEVDTILYAVISGTPYPKTYPQYSNIPDNPYFTLLMHQIPSSDLPNMLATGWSNVISAIPLQKLDSDLTSLKFSPKTGFGDSTYFFQSMAPAIPQNTLGKLSDDAKLNLLSLGIAAAGTYFYGIGSQIPHAYTNAIANVDILNTMQTSTGSTGIPQVSPQTVANLGHAVDTLALGINTHLSSLSAQDKSNILPLLTWATNAYLELDPTAPLLTSDVATTLKSLGFDPTTSQNLQLNSWFNQHSSPTNATQTPTSTTKGSLPFIYS